MNSCESHDDIVVVYKDGDCPLCDAGDEIDGLDEQIETLEESYQDLKDEADNHVCEVEEKTI